MAGISDQLLTLGMDHPISIATDEVPVRRVNGQVETGFFAGTLMI